MPQFFITKCIIIGGSIRRVEILNIAPNCYAFLFIISNFFRMRTRGQNIQEFFFFDVIEFGIYV